LKGKWLGILGLGRIGREVARISKAFGMEVLAWGPTLTDERAAEAGAQRLELNALLEASDVVSVHLKSTAQSRVSSTKHACDGSVQSRSW
jgi:phosphoglycerate dehydrogenase-like enzyme